MDDQGEEEDWRHIWRGLFPLSVMKTGNWRQRLAGRFLKDAEVKVMYSRTNATLSQALGREYLEPYSVPSKLPKITCPFFGNQFDWPPI